MTSDVSAKSSGLPLCTGGIFATAKKCAKMRFFWVCPECANMEYLIVLPNVDGAQWFVIMSSKRNCLEELS